MKNSKLRRALLLVACAVLLVSISVSATLAYLTSKTEVVTNTFSVGSVNITLDETDVDVYGVKDGETRVTKNDYKLIPGHTYVKDPIVHVTSGSEKCYLFVKVTNPITAIEDEKTIATQMEEKGWKSLNGEDDVYYYDGSLGTNGVVDALNAAVNVPVFDNFKIKGDEVTDLSSYNGLTITVQAYAVQADGFGSAQAAWTAAEAEWGPLNNGTTEDNTEGSEDTGA